MRYLQCARPNSVLPLILNFSLLVISSLHFNADRNKTIISAAAAVCLISYTPHSSAKEQSTLYRNSSPLLLFEFIVNTILSVTLHFTTAVIKYLIARYLATYHCCLNTAKCRTISATTWNTLSPVCEIRGVRRGQTPPKV